MSTARIDVWIWSLIYVGIVMLSLGISMRQTGSMLSWLIGGFGVVIAVTGSVLIWFRAKKPDPVPGQTAEPVANQPEQEPP